MKIRLFLAIALVMGFGLTTFAQTATPKASKRQVKQQVRIQEGKNSGELTRKETAQLQAQQVHINRTKKRAKADGVVTPGERAQIQKKQNRANRNIRRKKNNDVSRN